MNVGPEPEPASERPEAVAIVVMGVSGSGKTSIGKRIASRLPDCSFEDADAYHSEANVAKMAAGIPLDDDDRAPWLQSLRRLIEEHLQAGRNLVLACSALKQRYRDTLRAGDQRVHFVYLKGDAATIGARMRHRAGHYMKAGMLASQFAALEEPTSADTVTVDVRQTPAKVVGRALAGLAARGVAAAADGGKRSLHGGPATKARGKGGSKRRAAAAAAAAAERRSKRAQGVAVDGKGRARHGSAAAADAEGRSKEDA